MCVPAQHYFWLTPRVYIPPGILWFLNQDTGFSLATWRTPPRGFSPTSFTPKGGGWGRGRVEKNRKIYQLALHAWKIPISPPPCGGTQSRAKLGVQTFGPEQGTPGKKKKALRLTRLKKPQTEKKSGIDPTPGKRVHPHGSIPVGALKPKFFQETRN